MQTWLAHMRQPSRLLRDLGPAGFFTFQLIVGGNVLAALVHPLFMAALIYSVASGTPLWGADNATVAILAAIYGMTVVIGYLTSAFLGWLGLSRRGLLATAWVLVLTPAHWLLLSLAAWRALYQLVTAPYAWEKTEHGLGIKFATCSEFGPLAAGAGALSRRAEGSWRPAGTRARCSGKPRYAAAAFPRCRLNRNRSRACVTYIAADRPPLPRVSD
jgi:hypothetical protein